MGTDEGSAICGRPAQENVVVLSRCAVARRLVTPRAYCAGAFVISGPGTGAPPAHADQLIHHTDALTAG
jgi:hypothetical protein